MVDQAIQVISFLAYLFILAIGVGFLVVSILFVRDVTQTRNAVRWNFPVIGRFRSLFDRLGEFFRQYFFAIDREELPFNRAERTWVDRAAKDGDSTVAFDSTRDLRPVGTLTFVNCPYPVLERDVAEPRPVTVGPQCPNPYTTTSIFNISGMSFGAISEPAVLALSAGTRDAGIWMNTGEGALSPYHLDGGTGFVVSARGFMFALGCIQALQCNRNTCPTGITTHNKRLQRGLVPANKAACVSRYAERMATEIGIITHSCGAEEPRALWHKHCRVVMDTGQSVPYDVLFPDVFPRTDRVA